MTEFSLNDLRQASQALGVMVAPGSLSGRAVHSGQIRRLEDMDGLAPPEIVLVVKASASDPTAIVALVHPEPAEATGRDLVIRLEGVTRSGTVDWVVMPDTAATVWTEQLASSGVICHLNPAELEFVQDLCDPEWSRTEAPETRPLPESCRFGLLRVRRGGTLWQRRVDRARSMQRLSEDAWASGPLAAALPAPALLNDLEAGTRSWEALIDVATSASQMPHLLMGGNLFRESAAKLLGTMDPTAFRAIEGPGLIQGLHALSNAHDIRAPARQGDISTEAQLAREAIRAVASPGPRTVVFLRTRDQEPKLEVFAASDDAATQHHLVTHLVGGAK